MRYTVSNSMKKAEGIFWGTLSTIFIVLFIPSIASAQAYVPVVDIQLNPAFINAFGAGAPNGNTDAIRDLISGSNPNTSTLGGPCVGGNNLGQGITAPGYNAGPEGNPAFAYSVGPWMDAHKASVAAGIAPGSQIPAAIPDGAGEGHGPYVQINYSQSLRCLLMEQVEWQKLALSLQIHSLLKTYIADAQTTQLTKQLKNRITATNLNFAKSGNQVNNNGVQSSAPVFVTNYNQNLYDVNDRQIEDLTDQAAADPLTAGPQGSLGVCQPWRLDTAVAVAKNLRTAIDDPAKHVSSVTTCKLDSGTNPIFANTYDYNSFSENFEDPSSLQGSFATFHAIRSNPANNPLGAASLLDMAARARIEKQEASTKAEAQNSGFLPTKVCSGDASDPHCLDTNSISTNPGGQNASNINDLTNKQNDAIVSNALDAQGAGGVATSSTDINTNTGLDGANTLPLETSPTAVNQLIQEFYDAIQIGYFGIHQNTTEWAQATMLSIYDEMKINPDLTVNPVVAVVTDGQAAVPIGY